MQSFDVFDTLIGRICYAGTEIFGIMEKKLNIPNFKAIRMESEVEGIINTYNRMIPRLPKDVDISKLIELELQLEYEFSFPIVKYLSMIQSNDILVSDMYLSEDQIRKLISKHQPCENRLYVSSGGKTSGQFWKNKEITGSIQMHYGDNYRSDYQNAIANGIPATFIDNVGLSQYEMILSNVSKEFAYINRAIRLTTQNNTHFFNTVFTDIFLPMGICICFWLYQKYRDFNADEIIFLSRDGYWFKEMFHIMFPRIPFSYEYFSRLMCQNDSLRSQLITRLNNGKRKIIFDLAGSGTTFHQNFFGKIGDYTYVMAFNWTTSNFPNMQPIIRSDWSTNYLYGLIEDIYSAPHGSIDRSGSIMAPEYQIDSHQNYLQGLRLFQKYTNIYQKYMDPQGPLFFDVLEGTINQILVTASSTNKYKEMSKYIAHVNNHQDEHQRYPLAYYSQIGQDQHYIERIARFRPNGTFMEIGGYDGVIGSNTLFLEKNLGWKGVIVECVPHLAEKCRQNRTAIVYEKAVYSKSGERIDIEIPQGDEIEGGREQLAGIKNHLRPESRSYFSASFRTTTIIQATTITINEILEEQNLQEIDYLSLDIEGYELEALKTVDHDRFKIWFLTVEHGGLPKYQEEIRKYLLSKGYQFHRTNRWDDEYYLPHK